MCAKLNFSPICNHLILTFSKIKRLLHFGKAREKIWSKFSKHSAKFWQNLQHFVKISKKFSNFEQKN